MKKLLIIVTILALLCLLVACGSAENTLDSQIKAQALKELNLGTSTQCTLTFLEEVECEWQDGTCEEYILEVNGTQYFVGVRRNGNELVFVDVEQEV